MPSVLFVDGAVGVLFVTCEEREFHGKLADFDEYDCQSLRVLTGILFLMFVPIIWEIIKITKYYKTFFKKKQVVYHGILLLNLTYILATSIYSMLIIDFLAEFLRYVMYITVLYILNRKAKILDHKASLFTCAKIFVGLSVIIGTGIVIYCLTQSPEVGEHLCPGMTNKAILSLEVGMTALFLTFIFVCTVLRARLLREENLINLDRVTRQKVLRDSKLLNMLVGAIIMAELTGAFMYGAHLVFNFNSCDVVPSENKFVKAVGWTVYKIITHVIPVCIMIRCFWTMKDDDGLSSFNPAHSNAYYSLYKEKVKTSATTAVSIQKLNTQDGLSTQLMRAEESNKYLVSEH